MVVEVRVGKICSLPLLEVETSDSRPSELDVMASDESVLELADAVSLVPVKAELEVNVAIDDEVELDPLTAGFEVVSCVPEAMPGETVGIETAETFLLGLSVSVTPWV